MDKLSDAQLADLRARCTLAISKGYEVARAEDYMKALAAEMGTKLLECKPTVSDLLQSVNAIIERRARGPKSAPVSTPEPVIQKPTVVPDGKPEIDVDSFFDAERPTVTEAPKSKSKKNRK